MSGYKEVLFVSDENDPASSVDCFDLQIGTKIGMYSSGHGVVRGSLRILGEEYFLSAEVCKPHVRGSSNIHVWSIDTRNQVKRITVPGEVTALSTSEDDFYCAAGINNKVHVWNLATGQLLNVISYHHEPITNILFWNSNYFITSGADGLVAVWRLVDVVCKETGDSFGPRATNFQQPYFSSSKHALPVTDMFLASGGNTSKLFTVSADQNCHIFSIGVEGGKFLLALTYDYVLTAVLCDHLQRTLFVGTSCGKIILSSMEPSTLMSMRHVSDENYLDGHTGAIKALSITQEDDLLASGSDDRKVIIWKLSTQQPLHTCDMHGFVSNLFFRVVKMDFLTPGSVPKTVVSSFDKNIISDPENMEIKICMRNEVTNDDEVSFLEDMFLYRDKKDYSLPLESKGDKEEPNIEVKDESDSDTDADMICDEKFNDEPTTADYRRLVKLKRKIFELRSMNRRLKRVNRKLYIFGLEQIWQHKNVREPNA